MYNGLLINDTSNSMHYGSINVVKNILDACHKNGLNIIQTVLTNSNWKDEKYLNNLDNFDFVIVNGEGSMHSSKGKALLMSEAAVFFKHHHIPTFLINTVYQNNSSEIDENMKSFTKIYCRDSISQQILDKKNIESTFVPEMIFYKNYFKDCDSKQDIDTIYSGSFYKDITLSNYIQFLKNRENSQFITIYQKDEKVGYKQLLGESLLLALVNIFNLISLKFLQKMIIKNFNIRKLHRYSYDFNEFVTRINSSKKLMTGYFHMTCFSIIAKKPFVSIESNTHKTQALLNDIKLDINKRFLDKSELNNLVEIDDFTKSELENIELFLNESPIRIDAMFQEIYDSVDTVRKTDAK